MTQPKNILFDSLNVIACVNTAGHATENSCNQTMKMQVRFFARLKSNIFVYIILFFKSDKVVKLTLRIIHATAER